jgi:hypothetical protein
MRKHTPERDAIKGETMRSSLTLIAMLTALMAVSASADTVPPQQVLEFSPAPDAAGE